MIALKKTIPMITMTSFLLFSSPVLADDNDITTAVKAKLSNNPTLSKDNIKVETKDSVVTLTGDVNTEKEANAAVQETSSVDGVSDVDTANLNVKGSADKNAYQDAYITAKVKGSFVKEKLFGDKPIDVSGIKVETKNGVVTLSGTADNEDQVNNAISLAKKIKGVSDVQSNVQVNQATQ